MKFWILGLLLPGTLGIDTYPQLDLISLKLIRTQELGMKLINELMPKECR